MKIRGTTTITRKQWRATKEKTVLKLTDLQNQQMNDPQPSDIMICLTTDDPKLFQLIAVQDVPLSCRDTAHLVDEHLEDLYNEYLRSLS